MIGKKFTRAISFLLILISLAACAQGSVRTESTPTFEGAQPVNRLFSALYQSMGEAAGPVVSALVSIDNAECQYTLNTLMCFDSSRAGEDAYFLAPLARDLGLAWPELASNPNLINFDGIPTRPEFYAYLYKYFNGTRFSGKPISPVIYNYEEQRVEQYFENLVLYHHFSDPLDEVHLAPLGHAACWQNEPDQCSYRPELDNEAGRLIGYIEVPYPQLFAFLDDLYLLGRVLTPPFLAPDGQMQQIWENMVFTWPVDHPEQAQPFPLSEWMLMPGTLPGPQQFDMRQNILFLEIHDGLGYHIPKVFDEFSARINGKVFSGLPTGDYMMTEDGTAVRQCYINYCLIYDLNPSLPNDLRVRMLPLGVAYRDQYYTPSAVETPAAPTANPANAALTIRENQLEVTSKDTQVIEAAALDGNSGLPLPDLEVRLEISLPNGEISSIVSPATDSNGLTSIEIPPQPGFQHGLVVAYQACLLIPGQDSVCQDGSYLLWDLK